MQVTKKIITFALLLIVIVGAVFSVVYLGGQATEDSDLLYVNLKESPAYVKNGFAPGVAEGMSLDSPDWEKVFPAGHGAIIAKDWVADDVKNERKFFSPYDQAPGEYTILIPFEMKPESIAKMHQAPIKTPGLFLAGIGDNWEIYLNGKMIESNVHLDENNRITTHRAWRNVVFPLDQDLLIEGSNQLVFRIIGSPSDKKTGLYYASPHYIGEYSSAVTEQIDMITLLFIGIYIFVGIYHLLLFLMRRNNTYNLFYGFFSIAIALYFLSKTAVIYSISENSAITQRIEYTMLYILPFLLAAFIEMLNFKKLLLPSKIYICMYIVFIALQAVFSIQFAIDLLSIWFILGGLYMVYTFVYVVIVTFFRRIKAQKRRLQEEGINVRKAHLIRKALIGTSLGNIFIIIIFLFITTAFDMLDSEFIHLGVMLTSYSFFFFTVGVALILAREFASSYNQADKMNEVLEALVKERTVALEKQVDIAERASRAKGDFLANMSHEMRTPINAVVGMTVIGKSAEDISKKDYCFNRIDEASTHLLGVINDILDISKIEADKLELASVTYDFRSVIKRVVHVITFKTEEKEQKFTVDIDDKIPTFLIGDDQRLAQVITNLLSNAVKFTPEGGSIVLSAALDEKTDEDCTLHIQVKDSGIGISEEQQSRLFVPFQQADSGTSRSYGGTGLGLSISKRVVELMNGEIWVTSKPGEGSVFGFTIRAKHVQKSEMTDEPHNSDEIVPGEFEGHAILLVDDVEINREIVISILEETGLFIEAAENGEEAVEKFEADPNRFGIILMDVQMPVMDGYTATEQIRALAMDIPNAEKIPIIAMTANVFKEDVEKSKKAGMDAHIGKPINVSDLLLILRKYLR
ncbi:hypothetical protein FACS18947_0810 [Bacteroidia bacterium]|nr:hypothetical protein FACS18947_0810 [Bacteroidia bacterium]